MKSACISFLRAAEALQPVPTHIESLLKERVEHAFVQTRPNFELRFDDASCPQHGEYSFGLDRLKLSARSENWQGVWNGSFSDVLDGKTLDFSGVVVEAQAPALAQSWAQSSRSLRPAYGLLIGATAGALGGYALSPNRASRPMNALVFGLCGALTGALLGLVF